MRLLKTGKKAQELRSRCAPFKATLRHVNGDDVSWRQLNDDSRVAERGLGGMVI